MWWVFEIKCLLFASLTVSLGIRQSGRGTHDNSGLQWFTSHGLVSPACLECHKHQTPHSCLAAYIITVSGWRDVAIALMRDLYKSESEFFIMSPLYVSTHTCSIATDVSQHSHLKPLSAWILSLHTLLNTKTVDKNVNTYRISTETNSRANKDNTFMYYVWYRENWWQKSCYIIMFSLVYLTLSDNNMAQGL